MGYHFNMKFYKLKSLIYFFLYKFNRWFGGKTKWDIQDWQCISADWEHCMMINSLKGTKRDMGIALRIALERAIIVPRWINIYDNIKITNYTTLSGDSQWSDCKSGNADPLNDIKTGIICIREKFGRKPNVMKISSKSSFSLICNPDVLYLLGFQSPKEVWKPKIEKVKILIKGLFGLRVLIDEDMGNNVLIAYEENDKVYPDSNAMYMIYNIR